MNIWPAAQTAEPRGGPAAWLPIPSGWRMRRRIGMDRLRDDSFDGLVVPQAPAGQNPPLDPLNRRIEAAIRGVRYA